MEHETSQEVHLIDLKDQLKDMTVIDNFIVTNGEDSFESRYEDFLRNLYFFLDIDPCDMYFEDIVLVRKDTFYIEIQLKDEMK